MKKTILLIAACVALAACDNNRKLAVAYLESQASCPSTIKIVSEDKGMTEMETYVDTLYHVSYIHKDMFAWIFDSRYVLGEDADYCVVDSMKVVYDTLPALEYYLFRFDAQNLMGAMVRDSLCVFVYDGHALEYDDMVELCHDMLCTSKVVPYHDTLTVSDCGARHPIVELNKWVNTKYW